MFFLYQLHYYVFGIMQISTNSENCIGNLIFFYTTIQDYQMVMP